MKRASIVRNAVFAIAVLLPSLLDAQEVSPSELQKSRPMELGQLLLLLMPDANQKFVGWDHRSDSGIVWMTNGYASSKRGPATVYVRTGVVRVHVQGAVTTILKQRKVELGWSVKYEAAETPKFGPTKITIAPAGLDNQPCFGSLYSGCSFAEPLASLRSAGIEFEALCKTRKHLSISISSFSLKHPARRQTVMVWSNENASGGDTTELTLILDAKPSPNICAEF